MCRHEGGMQVMVRTRSRKVSQRPAGVTEIDTRPVEEWLCMTCLFTEMEDQRAVFG